MNNPVVNATQQLGVTLEAQQWNQVLAAMSEAPYKVSAPLIQSISQQLQEQAERSEQGQGQPLSNGQGGMVTHPTN